MPRGVVFFDIDGSLIPDTSSGQHLAELWGHAEVVREAEAGYAAGILSNEQVCVLDARGWAARSPAEVRGFLETLPLVEGIVETIDWCRRQRLAPVLATLAWDAVGAYLCDRSGFESSCGPRLEVVSGRYSGDVAAYFDERDKRDYAVSVAAHTSADGNDLREVLPLLAAWLETVP